MAEHVDRHAARGGTASQRHHAGFSTNNAALSESPLLHPFQSRPHNLIVPSLAESNHNLPTSITSHDLHNGLSLLSPESFRDKDIDRLLGIGSDEGSDGGEYANDHHFHDGDQNRQLSRKRKTMNGRNRRRKKSSGNHDDSLRDSDSDSETSSFYSNEESDGGSTQSSERHKASPFDIRSGERMDESQMLLGTSLQSGDSSFLSDETHEEDEHSFSDDAQRIVNIDEHVDAILNEEGDILLEEESGHDEHVTQHHDFTDALSTHADDSITEEGRDSYLDLEREALSLVRVQRLPHISSNLMEYWNQVGKASTVKKKRKFIAIGTTKGYILVYNHTQRPFALCAPTPEAASSGYQSSTQNSSSAAGVTCMDMFENHLVAGYADGRVILWDLNTKSILKTITEHFNGTPLNFVFFLRDKFKIFACNEHTSIVFNINWKLFRQSVFSNVITEGEYGAIRHVALLPAPKAHNPTNEYLVVAFGTHDGIVVKTLRPFGKVPLLHKARSDFVIHQVNHPNPDASDQRSPTKEDLAPRSVPATDASSLLYLDWWGVTASSHDVHNENSTIQKGRDPILGVAWGCLIRFYQLVYMENRLSMIKLSEVQMPNDIRALKWIDERAVIAIDSAFNVSVVDPFTRQLVQSGNVSDLGWAYHSRFDHPVTVKDEHQKKRQYLAKCPAFHHTIDASGPALFLLGTQGIDVISILSWQERIDALIEIGNFPLAFELGLKIFRNESEAVGVVGLPRDFTKAQFIVAEHIINHLRVYLDKNVKPQADTSLYMSEQDRKVALFKEAVFCIDIALGVNRIDIVFADIYVTFDKMNEKQIFIKVLERFILQGKLEQIPKHILDMIIKSYVENNDNATLEKIILNIDTLSMEFSTLIRHCKENQMYSTLIHVYTTRQRFVDPIHVLLEIASEHRKTSKERYQQVIALIFDYLSCTFRGLGFPIGSIPQKKLKSLKLELLFELFAEGNDGQRLFLKLCSAAPVLFSQLMTQIFSDTSPTTPWKQENRAGLVTEDERITFEGLISQIPTESCIAKQDAINFMMEHLVDFETDNPKAPWTVINPKEQTHFFVFLNKFTAQGLIRVDEQVLLRMVAMITFDTEFDQEQKIEIQEEIVEMLKLYSLSQDLEKQIILNCEKSAFYIVCVYLYTKRGEYSNVLVSYLRDEYLKEHVFDSISLMLKNSEQDSNMLKQFKTAVMDHLATLISLNCSKTARLVIDYFHEEHEKVVSLLENYPEMQFEYLKTYLGPEAPLIDMLLKKKGIAIREELHQKYLELLCRFQPETVYAHLTSNRHQYPLEQSIQLCKKYEILDAAAYLLERAGDIHGAVHLLLEDIERRMGKLEKYLEAKAMDVDPNNSTFTNVDTFHNSRSDKYLIQRIGSSQPDSHSKRRRSHRNRQREYLPKVDSQNVLDMGIVRNINSLLMRLLDILSQSHTEVASEVRGLWFNVMQFFIDSLRTLQANYEGRKLTKLKPTKKKEKKNLEISFDSDSSETESEEEDLEQKRVTDVLLAQKKRIEYEINNEMDAMRITKLKQDLQVIMKRIRDVVRMDGMGQHNQLPPSENDKPKLTILWMQKIIGKCFRIVYERAVDYIPIHELLEVFTNNYSQDEFGHLRGALMDAINKMDYAVVLHKAVIGLTDEDIYKFGHDLITVMGQGIHASETACSMCWHPLSERSGSVVDSGDRGAGIIVFPCGHTFHASCLTSKVKNPRCITCARKPTNPLSKSREDDVGGHAARMLVDELQTMEQEEEFFLQSQRRQFREAQQETERPVVRNMFLHPDKDFYATDLHGRVHQTRNYRLSKHFHSCSAKGVVQVLEGVNIMAGKVHHNETGSSTLSSDDISKSDDNSSLSEGELEKTDGEEHFTHKSASSDSLSDSDDSLIHEDEHQMERGAEGAQHASSDEDNVETSSLDTDDM